MSDKPAKKRFGRLEALILIPNLILLGVVLIYLGVTSARQNDAVKPAETGDPKTAAMIARLEDDLLRNPANMSKAIRLARLYREVGEFPWSYNALLNAERKSKKREPLWQLRLGLAYMDLAKNKDALRVLEAAHKRCGEIKCGPNVQVKLGIFTRLARIMVERKIDWRKQPKAADQALQEILKPVTVDPTKMHPKGPAQPEKTAPAPAAKPTKPAAKPKG